MVQKGKHQHLSTLMRTVKDNVEQTILEAEIVQEESDAMGNSENNERSETESVATSVHMKKIQERMKFCKNALRIL